MPYGNNYLVKIIAEDDAGNVNYNVSDETFTISGSVLLSISIIQPRGHLYIMDREVARLPGNTTIVVGAITIGVDIKSRVGIEKIEIYIDDKIEATLTEEPYQWTLEEKIFFTHTIKVIAYDIAEKTAIDEQMIWISNF